MEAAKGGDTSRVRDLLQQPETDPNFMYDPNDYYDRGTALHWAALRDHSQIVQLLLRCPRTDTSLKNKAGFGRTAQDTAQFSNMQNGDNYKTNYSDLLWAFENRQTLLEQGITCCTESGSECPENVTEGELKKYKSYIYKIEIKHITAPSKF